MLTKSNPQQPAIEPARSEPTEPTTTAGKASPKAPASPPKPAATKRPAARQAARQRADRREADANTPARKRPSRAAERSQSKKPAPTTSANGPREGSTMWAILQVLGEAAEPLTPKEIYAQIAERKLASGLKGKTPDQSVAAALAVAAKQGRYVERAAPGKFRTPDGGALVTRDPARSAH